MERYRGVEKIKTYDEYMAAKSKLEAYVADYKWFKETPNPLESMNARLDDIIERRNNAITKEAMLDAESEGQHSRVRFAQLTDGNYEEKLLRNISALVVSIDEYEARISRKGVFSALTGDQEAIDNIKKRYVFFVAQLTGEIPGEIAVNVEPIDSILSSLQKSNEWISFEPYPEHANDIEQPNELSLVAVSESVSNITRIVSEIVSAYLQEKIVSGNSETKSPVDYKSATKSITSDEVPHGNTQAKSRSHISIEEERPIE